MTFSNLKPEQQACLAWASSLINAAGNIFFIQCKELMGNYPWLPHDNPVDNLKHVLQNWTLDPTWERYGSFIAVTNFDHLAADKFDRLNLEGEQFLTNLVGGWHFKLQFSNLSCGVDLHTTDEELAKELIGLIVANMETDDYKQAAVKKNKLSHVYANQTQRSLFVATDKEHRQVQGKELILDRDKSWLDYAYQGGEYLGARKLVNMSEAVSNMHR